MSRSPSISLAQNQPVINKTIPVESPQSFSSESTQKNRDASSYESTNIDISASNDKPSAGKSKFVIYTGNGFIFFILYIICMLPSYFLPFLGSNSALVGGLTLASGIGINPATLVHAGSLVLLIGITWLRGIYVNRRWLIIFPVLGSVFDLIPGLNQIPFVPTFMHLFVIIIGIIPARRHHIDIIATSAVEAQIVVPHDPATDADQPTSIQSSTPDLLPATPHHHEPEIHLNNNTTPPHHEKNQAYFIPFVVGFTAIGAIIFGVSQYFGLVETKTILQSDVASKTLDGTNVDTLIGVWVYSQDNSNRYLRIEKNHRGHLIFQEGWDQQGQSDIFWSDPSLENAKEIILTEKGDNLEAQFVSDNFRATHAVKYTYKIELSPEDNDKLHYKMQMLRNAPKQMWSVEENVFAKRMDNTSHSIAVAVNQPTNQKEAQAKKIAFEVIKPIINICNGSSFIKEHDVVWELRGKVETYGCHEPPTITIAGHGEKSWSCGIEIAAPEMRMYNPGQGWSNWNEANPFLLGVTHENDKWHVDIQNLNRISCEQIVSISHSQTNQIQKVVVNTPGDGFLALRSEPSGRAGHRILKIPHGTELILGDCVDGANRERWCKTDYSGKNGWVLDRYINYRTEKTSTLSEKGPRASFDCALAKHSAEIAICQNNFLGQFDKELAEIYFSHLKSYEGDPDIIKELRDGQKKWLGDRNKCGSDVHCLRNRYQERIGFLNEFEGV